MPSNGGLSGGQQSSSTFHDQSLVTPNMSNGGKKLQTQLEQVLMMKSGEFSAEGRRPGEVFMASDQHFYPVPENRGDPSHYQNYGNPNFVPPERFYQPPEGQSQDFYR